MPYFLKGLFFKKEFFFKNPEVLNKEQLLSSMCETLVENNYTDDLWKRYCCWTQAEIGIQIDEIQES